jgi:hypothetical protein
MTYHYLTNSTTASAADMVDNYEHIGVGDCLPLGGTMLSETTGVYDLGSDSYRWNNLFCQNLNIYGSITGVGNLWVLESEITITQTTASIEFSGLDGDLAKEYLIISQIMTDDNLGSMQILFNQDSGTNYGEHYLHSKLVHGRTQNNVGYNIFSYYTSSSLGFSRMIISSESRVCRTMISITDNECNGGESIWWLRWSFGIWNNTSDTLTSIKILSYLGANFATNTNISLWKRA